MKYHSGIRNHCADDPTGKRSKSKRKLSGFNSGPKSRFSDHDIATALVLIECGCSLSAISCALGCPKSTLYQWQTGIVRAGFIRSLE